MVAATARAHQQELLEFLQAEAQRMIQAPGDDPRPAGGGHQELLDQQRRRCSRDSRVVNGLATRADVEHIALARDAELDELVRPTPPPPPLSPSTRLSRFFAELGGGGVSLS